MWFPFDSAGTVGPSCDNPNGVVRYEKTDALFFDAKFNCWVPWFSGVRSGLTTKHDINALDGECGPISPSCQILLSFKRKSVRVPGVGKVASQDVVGADWVGGTADSYDSFFLVLDGSDVGLTETG